MCILRLFEILIGGHPEGLCVKASPLNAGGICICNRDSFRFRCGFLCGLINRRATDGLSIISKYKHAHLRLTTQLNYNVYGYRKSSLGEINRRIFPAHVWQKRAGEGY